MATSVFSKKVTELFDHEVIRYQDQNEEICLVILPEKGQILDIKLHGFSLLCGPKNKEELINNSAYKSSFLLPFPNRLADGKFTFQDQAYQFPLNDTKYQSALHGFKQESNYKVVCEEAGSSLFVSLEYNYDGSLAYFPFPFVFNADIRIDKFKCELSLQIQNTGQTDAPFGIGWHPYFTLQKPINECGLCIPVCKKVEIDDRFIPTGKTTAFKDFSKSKKIENTTFDNAFLLAGGADYTSIVLENDEYKLRYYQETKSSKFNYLQIYTPEDRQSIAFEPMTCNINAHNNGEGLQILAPNKKMRAKCGVALQAK